MDIGIKVTDEWVFSFQSSKGLKLLNLSPIATRNAKCEDFYKKFFKLFFAVCKRCEIAE